MSVFMRSAPESSVRRGREVATLLALAVPAMVTSLGYTTMGIVDTVMVGQLGSTALGGVALANTLYFTLGVLCFGLLDGVVPLVARSWGAGRHAEARDWFRQGLWLAAGAGLVLSALLVGAPWILERLSPDRTTAALGSAYLASRAFSAMPDCLAGAYRSYLYGRGETHVVTGVILGGNVMNLLANQVLIHGVGGWPGLGVAGAGWATTLCQLAMLVMLAWRVHLGDDARGAARFRRPDPARLGALVSLGFPIGVQAFLEWSGYSAMAVLAARFGASALAAHQVAVSLLCLAFVTASGLSTAAGIRVGQQLGRGVPREARRSGALALFLTLLPAAAWMLLFLAFPDQLVGLHCRDQAVLAVAVPLLPVVALLLVGDGLQVVAAGCLRGAGDTRTPLGVNLLCYWALGLPVGCLLGFGMDLGLAGLWWGLALALQVNAALLCWSFARAELGVAPDLPATRRAGAARVDSSSG